MDVNIGEVVSTVRAVDGDALLAPATLKTIVDTVCRALAEKESHEQRVRAEQRISAGVRAELEEEQ